MTKNYIKDNKELMKQWNYAKNKDVNVNTLTTGSGKKVWWICSNGHEWEASIYSRKNNSCPYCSNRKVLTGYNDLATTNPKLLKEWDYDKNNEIGIYPNNIMYSSQKKVWWVCPSGHSYFSEIRSRAVYGYGCRYCAHHGTIIGENDLEYTFPKLIKEWDYKKNDIDPNTISKSSQFKAWWICPNGHSYQMAISLRTNKRNMCGCPYCSNKKVLAGYNDLQTINPNIAKEWHPIKNGSLTPQNFTSGCGKKVWWICPNGHSYQMAISLRTNKKNKCGCPYCSGHRVLRGYNDLATTNSDLLKEWDYEKNDISPTEVSKGSNKFVYWICSKCGNKWKASINSRTRGNGCSYCSSGLHTSFPEQAIYYYLKKIYKDVSNRFVLDEIYEYDILIKDINVLIEYDGIYYHNDQKKEEYDLKKEKYALKKGFSFYRIKETKNSNYITSLHRNVFTYYPDRSKRLDELIRLILEKIGKNHIKDINVYRDFIKIENMINKKEIDNSLFNLYPQIASEWNYEKNNNMNPKNYLPRSGKIVWWKCQYGHEWKTRICDRFKNHKEVGCPYCSNTQVLEGFNDFSFKNPHLLKYWNYKKNSNVHPTSILYNSTKKVWWICPNGHSYRKEISKKEDGNDCPYCNNRRILEKYNDFGTLFPNILKDWDYKKNKINPLSLGKTSEYKASWKCHKCGYEWEATIFSRCNGLKKCPICNNYNVKEGINDLVTTNPELLKEWNYEKNENLSPEKILFGSTKQIWWKCHRCGYEWKISVCHRTIGKTGCPLCAKKNRARQQFKRIINLDTGEVFESLKAAAKRYNMKDTSSLTHCIQGKTKTCFGFKWKYYDE